MSRSRSSAARRVWAAILLILLASGSLSGGSQESKPQPTQKGGVRPDATPSPTASPTPVRTGRTYAVTEPARRPPPSAPQAPSPVTFADITAQTGINFRHAASPTSQKYLLETMGGGVALLDFDNDGRLDVFFTNGARLLDPTPRGVMPDKRETRFWNRLFRQKTDGTFEDVSERAGVRGEGYSMGVAVGDYNNDGWVDLYLTGYGANTLYHNNGDGTFADVTRRAGVQGGGWSTSAGWLDYDRDGRLDLFVARYLEWDFELGSIFCGAPGAGFRSYCHPNNFRGVTHLLYRQKTDETFEEVTAAARIADPEGKGLGVAFADFDGDGWTDIFVANDSVRQQLYRNNGDGTFEDIALPSGAGYDENGKTFAGMGVDTADYDNDGHPDVIITTLSNETYPLYLNNGDSTFSYVTNSSGVGQITLLYSGWGTRFIDADNDGWRDIFVAQGHVLDTIERISSYLTYKQTPLLMRNTGRGFVNVSSSAGASFGVPLAARGAAFGDLNNDGQMDVLISVLDGAPVILRNNGTRNRWIGLRLVGIKSNRDAAGARVFVTDANGRRQVFDTTNAGSYLSANDPRILVGLGAATGVRSIEIRWPSGRTQLIENPAIDKYHTINEQ
ncbi:MAG TPA: CRTAC1 family protein [Pyrinomonadaceae bacterium]|nr:CRTAC1 family protein [Pyrinomonadaceae bacterium]